MDTTDSPEVMTVLPKELRLGAPPTMPQARSYLFRQQSTLSNYNYDEQIQINIPRLQRSYLSKESYLQFRLNGQFEPSTPIEVGANFQMTPDLFLDDAGAWSLFERIEVFDYLGSTVLETIDGLPQLMSLLIDMGADFTDPQHEGAVAHGLQDSYTATNQNDTSTSFVLAANSNPATSITYPLTITGAQIKIKITTNTEKTYTFTGGPYADFAAYDKGLNDWLATLTFDTPTETGLPLQITAIPSALYANSFDLVSDRYYFTVTGVGTNTTSLCNYLGFTTGSTNVYGPTISTNQGVNIVSSAGVGKSFYCGGRPLACFGTTRATAKRSFSWKFAIPLPSFLGFLSKKMVPLHNGFTIVLTLASKFKPMFMVAKQVPVTIATPGNALNTGNIQKSITMNAMNTNEPQANVAGNINSPASLPDPTTFWWNITDVAMICQILELGPVAESMILSSSQGSPLIVHTKQLRNYRGTVGATTPEFSLPLNLNVSSLTNLLWFMRPNGWENNLRYASAGARFRNYLWRWEFQYGSTVLPQSQGIQCMETSAPVLPGGISFTGNDLAATWANCFTECYNELVKARPNIPSKGRISLENFSALWSPGLGQFSSFGTTPWRCISGLTASQGGGGTYGGEGETSKFACGLNTELVSGKEGNLICGLNTNGMNTTIRGYIHPNYVTSNQRTDVVVDAYAEYDAFINISPGIATTVSF